MNERDEQIIRDALADALADAAGGPGGHTTTGPAFRWAYCDQSPRISRLGVALVPVCA